MALLSSTWPFSSTTISASGTLENRVRKRSEAPSAARWLKRSALFWISSSAWYLRRSSIICGSAYPCAAAGAGSGSSRRSCWIRSEMVRSSSAGSWSRSSACMPWRRCVACALRIHQLSDLQGKRRGTSPCRAYFFSLPRTGTTVVMVGRTASGDTGLGGAVSFLGFLDFLVAALLTFRHDFSFYVAFMGNQAVPRHGSHVATASGCCTGLTIGARLRCRDRSRPPSAGCGP